MEDAGPDHEPPAQPDQDSTQPDQDSTQPDQDSTQPDQDSTQPDESSSSWSINWINVIPLLLIAVAVVIGWRWIEGADFLGQSDDSAGAVDTSTTLVPADEAAVQSRPTTTETVRVTIPSTTSTTVANGPQVLIEGEMKSCQFGSNCLVASFTIEGFDEHSGRFVCIYPNSRRDFAFGDDDVDDACVTADAGDTITIEVDGVQSATISEENLDGTE